MRKIILAVLCALLLTSCSGEYFVQNSDEIHASQAEGRYGMQDLDDGFFKLAYEETAVYPAEEKIWAAGENGVGWYNPADKMEYTAVSDMPAQDIYINGEEIIVYGNHAISVIATDGMIVQEWAIEGIHDDTDTNFRICGNDNNIFLLVNRWNAPADNTILMVVIDRESGVSMHEVSGDEKIVSLDSIYPDQSDFCKLIARYTEGTGFTKYGVFRINDEGYAELLYTFDGSGAACLTNDKIYTFNTQTGGIERYIEVSERGEKNTVLRSVNMETFFEKYFASTGILGEGFNKDRLFCTGHDYLIYDGTHHVLAVYDMTSSDSVRTLNVIYPEAEFTEDGFQGALGEMLYDTMRFEEENDCVVKAQYYPVSQYHDRLRMKLLAGDDDMDIIYADRCEDGDLLSAILRYRLYEPLEDYSVITENFSKYADGVREYMTYDGHLIGIPFQFGTMGYIVTDAYLNLELSVPTDGWTVEEFWQICQAAEKFVGNGVVLCPDPGHWILSALIQNGVDLGELDYAAILEALSELKEYESRGLFADYGEAETFLLDGRINIPAQSGSFYKKEVFGMTVPYPLVSGNRYASMRTFTFMYCRAPNKDLAAEYLTMLSDEEFAAKCSGSKTYLLKDSEGYYQIRWAEKETAQMKAYTWNRIPEVMMGHNAMLAERTSELLPGTKMKTIGETTLNEKLNDIFTRLYGGMISVDTAADEIVSYANYRYFE